MGKYIFNATNRIAEEFEIKGVSFDVVNKSIREEVLVGFHVNNGPNIIMTFISRDNNNDVAARIFSLVKDVPKEKLPRVVKACNILNKKYRFLKFYPNPYNEVTVSYDFLVESGDDYIGKMAFELLIRTIQILNNDYQVFTKALYTNEKLQDEDEDFDPNEEPRDKDEGTDEVSSDFLRRMKAHRDALEGIWRRSAFVDADVADE